MTLAIAFALAMGASSSEPQTRGFGSLAFGMSVDQTRQLAPEYEIVTCKSLRHEWCAVGDGATYGFRVRVIGQFRDDTGLLYQIHLRLEDRDWSKDQVCPDAAREIAKQLRAQYGKPERPSRTTGPRVQRWVLDESVEVTLNDLCVNNMAGMVIVTLRNESKDKETESGP